MKNEEDTFNKLAYGMCNGLSFRTAFCNNISFGVHECTASEHYKVKECNCCIECAKRCTTYKNTLEKLIKELEHADQAEAEGNHE